MKLKLSHKGFLLIAMSFAFECVFVVGLFHLLERSEAEAARASHYKAVTAETNTLVTDLYEGLSTLVTYHQTTSSGVAQHYLDVTVEIPRHLAALKQLVADDPYQSRTLVEIEPDLKQVLSFMGDLKTNIEHDDALMAIKKVSQWNAAIRLPFMRLMAHLHDLAAYQNKNLQVDPAEEPRLRQLFKIILTLGICGNFALAVLAWRLTRGVAGRVETLTENTVLLSNNRELLPVQGGADEIWRLDVFFHQMADALRYAAEKERAIIENAVDVIFSLDKSGRFSKVSPAAGSAWGYEPDDLIGRKFEEIIADEDRPAVERYLAEVIAAADARALEARVKRRDKTTVYVLFSGRWVPSEEALFAAGHDISQRKQSEDILKASEGKIRSIIESMQVGLVIVDSDGIIQSTNPRMQKLFDYNENVLCGKHLSVLLGEQAAPLTGKFDQSLPGRSLGKVVETEARGAGGLVLPVEIMAGRLGAPSGPAPGPDDLFIVNFVDITERREVERMKQEFVAMVSHDLRTPLTSILSSLTLLSTGSFGALNDRGTTLVRNAEGELTRLIQIINDLLDIARMEAGRMEFQIESCEVDQVVARSINALQGIAQKQEIILQYSPSGLSLRADEDRLIQVLVNLIGNAIKFSPAGSPVAISVAPLSDCIEIAVRDHGPGIADAEKRVIFDRFLQLRLEGGEKHAGSGLGLAICKTIIEGLGGAIGVRDGAGGGSEFWLRLPV